MLMYRVEIGGQSSSVAKWDRRELRMFHNGSCSRINICVTKKHGRNIRMIDDWVS